MPPAFSFMDRKMEHELESDMTAALKTPNLIKRAQESGTVYQAEFTDAQWDRMLSVSSAALPRTLVKVIGGQPKPVVVPAALNAVAGDKLRQTRVAYILRRKKEGAKQCTIARELGVDGAIVSRLLKGL